MCLMLLSSLAIAFAAQTDEANDDAWVTYFGEDGPGVGKHIVFVTGDEEYRSEEGMPQIAKILSHHYGFRCTVLFAIDPDSGQIDPENQQNIPGMDQLNYADLMVVFTRFRDLPKEQMAPFVKYVESGRPMIGLRTATHAFDMKDHREFLEYSWRNPVRKGGFGKSVLGETWVAHHGGHGSESTRGILSSDSKNHPILRGIKDGDIWDPSDVYTVRLPLPEGTETLVFGQVVGGMDFSDPPAEPKKRGDEVVDKNDPMMPLAWVRHYETKSGETARVFTTTMGASQAFVHEGSRRLIVNACLWAVGLEDTIKPDGKVELVGAFEPSRFGFGAHRKGVKPTDLK